MLENVKCDSKIHCKFSVGYATYEVAFNRSVLEVVTLSPGVRSPPVMQKGSYNSENFPVPEGSVVASGMDL